MGYTVEGGNPESYANDIIALGPMERRMEVNNSNSNNN
jgi:hypothetical protein